MLRSIILATGLYAFLLFNTAAAAAAAPSDRCFASLGSAPSIQIIKRKIAFGTAKAQTVEMLSSTQIPNATERVAIKNWITMYNTCDQQDDLWRRANFLPSYVKRYNQFMGDLTLLASQMSNGGLTYGEFARVRAEQESQFELDVTALVNRFKNAETAGDSMALQAQQNEQQQKAQQAAAAKQQAETAKQQAETAKQAREQEILRRQQMYLNQQQIEKNQRERYTPPASNNSHTDCYMIGDSMHCDTR